MEREHQDMEDWGAFSIFKEAGRLLFKHIRLLHPFILAFLLPVALILFLEVIVVAWSLAWLIVHHVPPHRFAGVVDHQQQHHQHHRHQFDFHAFTKSDNGFYGSMAILGNYLPYLQFMHLREKLHAAKSICFGELQAPASFRPLSPFVPQILLTLVLFVLTWPLLSLATTAIAKAVHHIYSSNSSSNNTIIVNTCSSSTSGSNGDQNRGSVKSIFQSLPSSFFPIFTTSLGFLPLHLLNYALLAPLAAVATATSPIPPELLTTLLASLLFVGFLSLDSWFRLALQVAVLEPERRGLAVLQRSGKLVLAKARIGLALLTVYLLVSFAQLGVMERTMRLPLYEEVPVAVVFGLAGGVATVYVAFAAYWSVVTSVFYFVCKEECRKEAGKAYQRLDTLPQH